MRPSHRLLAQTPRARFFGIAAAAMLPVVATFAWYFNGGPAVGVSAARNQTVTTAVDPGSKSVYLPGAAFDPGDGLVKGTLSGSQGEGAGDGYYIVQLERTADDKLLERLRNGGVEILQYVPNQAFFVYAEADSINSLAEASDVRWIGRFLPEHKISPVLWQQLGAELEGRPLDKGISRLERSKDGLVTLSVSVFKRERLESITAAVLSASAGELVAATDLPANYFNEVLIKAPMQNIDAIAHIAGVIRIDGWNRPVIEDERAAHIVAGNYTSATAVNAAGYNPLTQFGVTGLGVSISMVDDGVTVPGSGGFYITPGNMVDGPLRGATVGAGGGHGHINASIIAGNVPFGALDGQGYNYGLGIAPFAHIINIPLLKSGYSGTNAQVYDDTVSTAGVNGTKATISNNSWGSGTNVNAYDSMAAQFDGFVRDASAAQSIDPLLIVFSAGNSGTSGLTRPKMSKNTIAVANSFNIRPELSAAAVNMDDIATSSSRGLAADGRIKPDIAAPGSVVTGSRAGDCTSVTSCFDANHAWSSGTSHAAPQISGVAALFTEYWKNTNAGANPSPSLIKAAIINTGREMNGVGSASAVPNGAEGWGRVNMKFMLNTGVPTKYVNETVPLMNVGQSTAVVGTVADATKPVRVTLVWTDPPGVSDPALVNNLDLTVTVGGNVYKGNVFASGQSATGGTADNRNNVENVWLPAGIAAGSPISIQINATALNGDGILSNGDTTDQHFSLVAHNIVETPTAVLAPAALAISSESCQPANNSADPGETISVNVNVANVGSGPTSNLVATLQPGGGVTNPSAAQNYGALAAGGASASRPFTFTVDPTTICGNQITLTLQLQDAAANLGTVTFTLDSGILGAASANVYAGAAVTIPDNDVAGVNIAVPISGLSGRIGDLDFKIGGTASSADPLSTTVGLNHSFIGDLRLRLTSPQGTTVTIMTNAGGSSTCSANNIFDMTLNDEAASVLTCPTGGTNGGPLTGSFRPSNALSAFDGQDPNGTWTLNVADLATDDLGSMRAFSLIIATKQCTTCEAAPFVTVGGRVTTPGGAGLRNAVVSIVDPTDGSVRSALTSSFGFYSFGDVANGRTYTLRAASKRYRFANRSLQVNSNLANVDFSGIE